MADEQGAVETTTEQVETTTEHTDSGTLEVQVQSGEPTVEALQAELSTAQSALKRVNAESAKRRKQLEAHAAEKAKRERAELSEVEKAQATAEEWEGKFDTLTSELNVAQMRAAFYDEADEQKLVFANPQAKRDAFTLSDLSDVVMDEDGMTGMPEAIKALVKSHPHLFGVAQSPKDISAIVTGFFKVCASIAAIWDAFPLITVKTFGTKSLWISWRTGFNSIFIPII